MPMESKTSVERRDAVLDSVTDRSALRAAAGSVTPVDTALPVDVERRLAALVGIDPVVAETDHESAVESSYDETTASHFAKRVLRVAEQVTIGSLLLLVGCAAAAAGINNASLQVHPVPLTIWAVAAAMAAVGLGALVTDPDVA